MSYIRSFLPDTVNSYGMYGVGYLWANLQPYLPCPFTADLISERLYIGDLASVNNLSAMKEQKITHVLSVFNGAIETYPDDFKYKIFHPNDDEWVQIDDHFDDAIQFIVDTLNENETNKIIVHCQRGVSRSVTIVAAYLLYEKNNKEKIPLESINYETKKIIKYIKQKREIADPNAGFINCLKKYICKINNYPFNCDESDNSSSD